MVCEPVERECERATSAERRWSDQHDGRRGRGTQYGTVYAVALPIQIAPSVLPADFSRLGDEIVALEKAGVDLVQWDVMDGQFVPNLTFGPDVIASVRDRVTLPFEAHLMVLTPDVMAARYVEAGCSRLIVHAEACEHLHRTLGYIAELGASPGVAINPATPVAAVAHVLDLVDVVLVMTVNPGFGGQRYLATMEPKIAELSAMLAANGRGETTSIEVDGGITVETAPGAVAAGASILVAGSALFGHDDGSRSGRRRAAGRGQRSARHRLTSAPPLWFDGPMGAIDDDPGLPLKLWPCSNGEYLPPPLDELRAEAMRRARASADDHARRHGWSRRQFLLSAAGMAAGLRALETAAADRARAFGHRARRGLPSRRLGAPPTSPRRTSSCTARSSGAGRCRRADPLPRVRPVGGRGSRRRRAARRTGPTASPSSTGTTSCSAAATRRWR